MKFTTTRSVNNNVFSVTIAYKEYGTESLTADDERKILESFPVELIYKDVTFSGNYQVSGGDVVANGSGDSISLSLNNIKTTVNNTFTVGYRIDANSISASELSGKTHLNKSELLAQGYCKLFEDKVKEKLKIILEAARNKKNNFTTVEDFIA